MNDLLGLAPTFAKGIIVTICSLILFVGSVYVIMSAIFGFRMAYLVLAVSLFGWMIVLSALWVVGQPKILGTTGTLPNLGPRGTEAHWEVFAAGPDALRTRFPETAGYPGRPWRDPGPGTLSSVDTAKPAIQKYLVDRAAEQLEEEGHRVCEPEEPEETDCVVLDPSSFVVQDVKFATSGKTSLVAAHAFFTAGGPEVTVYGYHDPGNVPVYSWSFLAGSVVGFLIHLPLLDRAEKKRKAILTGGTAPPWYGPA